MRESRAGFLKEGVLQTTVTTVWVQHFDFEHDTATGLGVFFNAAQADDDVYIIADDVSTSVQSIDRIIAIAEEQNRMFHIL